MGTFLKITGTIALTITIPLLTSVTALASTGSSRAEAVSGAHLQGIHSNVANTSKVEPHQLKGDSTYQPPDDIGGPSSSQGSGTR
ncbi:MAG TPA: hypothetical protein V6C78_09285 [Crinalium sp.]